MYTRPIVLNIVPCRSLVQKTCDALILLILSIFNISNSDSVFVSSLDLLKSGPYSEPTSKPKLCVSCICELTFQYTISCIWTTHEECSGQYYLFPCFGTYSIISFPLYL